MRFDRVEACLIGPHKSVCATKSGSTQARSLWTGLRDLDRLTNGLSAGSLIVVASRPSLGKSLLVFQIADRIAAIDRRAVVVVSAQDDTCSVSPTVAERLASVGAGIWPLNFRTSAGSRQRATSVALARLTTLPILLDNTARPTVTDIAIHASQFTRERSVPLGAIVVDDAQALIGDSGGHEPVVAQLRSLANGLSVPIIVTARVNRAIERRPNQRPRITDFNEPNATAVAVADVVITIYRDEVYHEDSPDAGLAELAILKHPFNRTGTVKVRLAEGRFRDC